MKLIMEQWRRFLSEGVVIEEIPLFVYGTLRSGEKNHFMLKGAPFLDDVSLPEFVRSTGIGPAIIRGTENDSVNGELYQVDLKTLKEIDEHEGHHYPRETVVLADGREAYAYVYNESLNKV